MAIPNFFQQLFPKRMVEIWNGHSEFFLTIFPKKTGRNSEWPKLDILNLFKPVMVCNGLESNEICTFLDLKDSLKKYCQKKNIFVKKYSLKKKTNLDRKI